MEISHQAHTAVGSRIESKSISVGRDADDEFDREFRDFIGSITLDDEELAAFLAMPECSVPEVRRLVAGRQSRVADT